MDLPSGGEAGPADIFGVAVCPCGPQVAVNTRTLQECGVVSTFKRCRKRLQRPRERRVNPCPKYLRLRGRARVQDVPCFAVKNLKSALYWFGIRAG